MTALAFEVFVTPAIPQYTGTLNLPNGDPMVWSPISTTLLYGERDAVLVDPPFTTDTTREVLAWVEKIGRDITQIYITHGHGDHWLGAPVLLERFPDAAVRATAGTSETWPAWPLRSPVRRSGTRCSRVRSRRPPPTSAAPGATSTTPTGC